MHVLSHLLDLSEDYPGIENWYQTKVVPGLKDGTRKQIVVERDNQIAAIGIAKDDGREKKICTVRVVPAYQNKGHGFRLIDQLLHWLNVDQPLITVGEHKLPQFSRLFNHYGFVQSSSCEGLYVPGRMELIHNETQVK